MVSDSNLNFTLEFEKPVRQLEDQIKELKEASEKPHIDLSDDVKRLQEKVNSLLKEIYQNLSIWERVQLSRHPSRPHTVEYIKNCITDFHEIKGDRYFANDPAVISGFGFIEGRKVCVIGIEKGRKTKEKIHHNFGMPRPEGYRKALRVMKLAAQFNIPIISLVDTPGAYPGIGAEERGQSSAIAENIAEMFDIKTPIISLVIGEGGSGGALGIAVADRVGMLEYSIYSVISPESCASILFSDAKQAEKAANALQLDPVTAKDLKIIHDILPEPIGGAHRDPKKLYKEVINWLTKNIDELKLKGKDELLSARYDSFRSLGNTTIESIDSAK